MKNYLLFALSLFLTSAVFAQNNTKYDMRKYGIPVTINAPEGATLKSDYTEEGRVEFDGESYDISKGKFSLNVSMDNNPEDGESIEKLVEYYKSDLYGEVVETLDNGFIYKDEYGSHDFYYFIKSEGKFIQFSLGFTMNDYTLEEIKALVSSLPK